MVKRSPTYKGFSVRLLHLTFFAFEIWPKVDSGQYSWKSCLNGNSNNIASSKISNLVG